MTVVDDVKGRIDILDLVSQHVPLQRSGRSYKALCPFHTEKTPSFFVFSERQTWRCFGACATGGDVFSFIMRIENLEFAEALKQLADQAGVTMPSHPRKGEGDALHLINEESKEFFCRLLVSSAGTVARRYLKERGLHSKTVEEFELGLSPRDSESLVGFLASKGYVPEQLVLAGVATRGTDGQCRDMFRGRLMFPIRDRAGPLAGFGARALDDSTPKYLNSPRTTVFDKGRILYGLHRAVSAIRERGQVVVVEGYMDTIMAHQSGYGNAVASMGTSLTREQATVLGSLAPQVVLALDADAAGQEATRRSLESSWQVLQRREVARVRGTSFYERPQTPTIKAAILPVGKDPDQILRENPQQWEDILNEAMPLMDYLFTTMAAGLDLDSAADKARMVDLLLPLVTAIPNPVEQDHYFQRLASLLRVPEATLRASLDRLGQRSRPSRREPRTSPTPFERLEHDPLEEYCLAQLLLRYEQREDWFGQLRPEYFRRPESREVFTNLGKCSTLEELQEELDEELAEYLDYLLKRPQPALDRKQQELALDDCVRRLEERYLRELKMEEEMRLAEAPDEEFYQEQEQILQLNQRLMDLSPQRSR